MSEKSSALAVLAEQRQADLNKRMEALQALESFDWKKLPPHIMAMVLMKKPYRGKSGEPDYYLSPEQALVFAMRCFELGLSPLSSEVWFDRDRWTVNVTLEGKIRLARERGITGAPSFAEVKRPWKKGAVPIAGYAEEPGMTATLKVGDSTCEYTCWLSEWYVPVSPVWKAKPDHMMRVRAYDKALAFAAGVGVSSMPDEREIQQEDVPELPPSKPHIEAKKVEWRTPPTEPEPVLVESQNDNLEPLLRASIDQTKKRP
jgi:hypothetical protein